MVNDQEDEEKRVVQMKQLTVKEQLEFIWKHRSVNNSRSKAKWEIAHGVVIPKGKYYDSYP